MLISILLLLVFLVFIVGLSIVLESLRYGDLPSISGMVLEISDKICLMRFFIVFMLLGFFGGSMVNNILPKFNLVFKIIIVILLLVSITIIVLILLSNLIELEHLFGSLANAGPDDVAQMVANSEFIDQQEATIHENERKLRKLYKEIDALQNRKDRIRKREVRLKIWNFVLSVISGILASILFHYISELLNWN